MALVTVAVIPARFGSRRFPGKALAPIAGKPLVRHVWERCLESGAFTRTIVATDDERIAATVRGFGGEVSLTSPACPSGSDRVAEVARGLPEVDVFLNVQGDEPTIHPSALAQLTSAFADPEVEMATLIRPLEAHERGNPNVVKAVLAASGDALYFSRADIPFQYPDSHPVTRYAHIGLYGYRRKTLLALSAWPPSPLEESERLEQLRALEHGVHIRCVLTTHQSIGVDTPGDVPRAEELLRKMVRRS
jgi:3-deoxy-manno-octulosonate cytidylyltransferase (CMP-KDO synthetase)